MTELKDIVEVTYSNFLKILKEIVSIKTVYTNPRDVEDGILYSSRLLQEYLPSWIESRDSEKNLLYINPQLNPNAPILYLCAHIDTVDAHQSEWFNQEDPFKALESDTHITGRGVNDCKAGIAFILYIAYLIKTGKLPDLNIGFLISFKEEGNQGKSSIAYAENFKTVLPTSRLETCVVSLENTVSIQQPNELAVYHREPGNFFIGFSNTLPKIREFYNTHKDFKPVAIKPIEYQMDKLACVHLENRAGHIATVQNCDNLICNLISSDYYDYYAILSGDMRQTSVLQRSVEIFSQSKLLHHYIVFNYREFVEVDVLRESLKDFDYTEHSPFRYAAGSDQSQAVANSPAIKYLKSLSDDRLYITFQDNPGRSDSSEIWNALSASQKQKILPVTLGPGHRSHTYNGVVRKTHGPNEGFCKSVGFETLVYLLKFVLYYKL